MKSFFWKQLSVSIIVAAGLIIFAALAVVIGQSRGSLFRATVKYKAVFEQTRGIYVGSEVTIHGKRTGNVAKTRLLPSGRVEIVFAAQKGHAFLINESSRAHLKTQGALGDRYINIITPDLSAPPIPEGGLVPSAPEWDLVSFLTGSLGGGQKKGEGGLKGLLRQVSRLAEAFDKKGLPGLIEPESKKDLKDALKTAKSILKKIDSGEGTLGALVNDKSLHDKAESILGKIDSGEGSLGAIINSKSAYSRLMAILGEKPKRGFLKGLLQKSSEKQPPAAPKKE